MQCSNSDIFNSWTDTDVVESAVIAGKFTVFHVHLIDWIFRVQFVCSVISQSTHGCTGKFRAVMAADALPFLHEDSQTFDSGCRHRLVITTSILVVR